MENTISGQPEAQRLKELLKGHLGGGSWDRGPVTPHPGLGTRSTAASWRPRGRQPPNPSRTSDSLGNSSCVGNSTSPAFSSHLGEKCRSALSSLFCCSQPIRRLVICRDVCFAEFVGEIGISARPRRRRGGASRTPAAAGAGAGRGAGRRRPPSAAAAAARASRAGRRAPAPAPPAPQPALCELLARPRRPQLRALSAPARPRGRRRRGGARGGRGRRRAPGAEAGPRRAPRAAPPGPSPAPRRRRAEPPSPPRRHGRAEPPRRPRARGGDHGERRRAPRPGGRVPAGADPDRRGAAGAAGAPAAAHRGAGAPSGAAEPRERRPAGAAPAAPGRVRPPPRPRPRPAAARRRPGARRPPRQVSGDRGRRACRGRANFLGAPRRPSGLGVEGARQGGHLGVPPAGSQPTPGRGLCGTELPGKGAPGRCPALPRARLSADGRLGTRVPATRELGCGMVSPQRAVRALPGLWVASPEPLTRRPQARSAGAQQAQIPPSKGPGPLAGSFPLRGTLCCLQPRTRGALLPRDAAGSSFAAPG